MKQQPITDDSFTEAEAMKIVRGLSAPAGARPKRQRSQVSAHAVLTRTVEEDVIPRLLAAHRAQAPAMAVGWASAHQTPAPITPQHVAHLVKLVLKDTPTQAAAYIEALHDRGVGSEILLLDLLTPTARKLGEMWEDDLCDFTEVTLGVMRLNNVIRLICAAFDADLHPAEDAPRALLVQAPGEKHGLGLAMVVHFFRRAGWHVQSEPVATYNDLVELAGNAWFSLAGLSVSCTERMETLAAGIAALRQASRNPSIRVMVGGPPFIQHPHLAEMVGADGTASDGQLAVKQAEKLVSHQARAR
jgi:methanogenic corrinoid protein MtbC1